MLLYYKSWMFYNHFIVILYHFLVLTYWHSAKCQFLFFLCFLPRRKSISDGVQMLRNFTENFYGSEGTQRALFAPRGVPRGGHKPPGCARRPGAPWWVVPTLGAPRTTSLLYKYPNIPKTLGESTKINSSHRKFQKHQIQSRHHHGGVHRVYWCISDDTWVVHCRPMGP